MTNLTISDVINRSEHRGIVSRITGQQTFWVFLAAMLACLALTLMTDTFATERNLFNVTRNFAFVGIIAPHLIRPLVRHDPADLVLPSALLAGLILVLADTGLQLLPFTQELKLGVAAALIGAPAFIWVAVNTRSIGR